MAFMSLKIFFRKKIKVLLNFAFFFIFVYLLFSIIYERSHNTVSVLAKSVMEHILMEWLYGFESFFCQVLIDFLFVVYLLFFL